MFRQLILLVVALCLVVAASAETMDHSLVAPADLSRFQRTVAYLRTADNALRSDFVVLAIDRLQHVYLAEAELARDEYARSGQDSGLPGWASAVERYAAQLPVLSEQLEQGAQVVISGGGVQGVTIEVEGRVLLLVHPRPDQQQAFEQDLLALFCAAHPCNEFTPGSVAEVAPIPVSTARIEPLWTFNADNTVCSHEGLEVVFQREHKLSGLRGLCAQLLHEIVSLSDEIAWQRRHNVAVDWENLSIQATARRPEHRVQLNGTGDSVLVVAPLLYASPGLLTQLAPWMKARQKGEGRRLQLDAQAYGWQ